ncbi:MAG: hypothetical protein WCF98_12305, partial [Synechococcus sp. ELA057]
AVRYRHQRLFPCLHPAIEPHLPLQLELVIPDGVQAFRLAEGDHHFHPIEGRSVQEAAAETLQNGPHWSGRRTAGAVTIDLRLG